ncbi:branched-chain amino acid ABC transporter permease [Bordetella genomosp. 1]|uniref:Branched-chain amino acid ABC transporter permease n=1 Tax=Bordetella genomosp. 1 TaxID=1395607 RepID=A0A261SVV3_9BORD|nr:branched-chain amino acid ABC transporter permease [Bordetella genomosp. 1]MDQ8031315.1 branched-chain amino acid ABC transporter permease [Bordetella sp.]OZI41000.1 branched-chain amino acid ABC transporter permease [Bordetella genomosp. 1]OZI69192.1 branched-chain amino acid ABC transporter permease [Bordetella genomosp. 1]
MDIFIQLLINGLLLGGAYIIISLGLTLIFGVVRVVNFAHGEFLMVGMYLVYLIATHLGVHPYAGLIPVVVILFALGALTQRLIIQPLLNSDEHIQIFATVGLSTILFNLALVVFGANVVRAPAELGTGVISAGGFTLVSGQVITFLVAIALTVLLHLFMHHTYLGRALRAVAQHRYAALLMGVNVNAVYVIAFGLGTAFVGVAAGLLAPQYPVFPTVGTYFVLTAFVIVVLGGLGSLYGAVAGSLIIGVVDTLAGYYIAPDLKEVVYFGIFLLILVLRPTGLFGNVTE